MYHTFFGLNEPAFSITVNPRYLYMSNQHREALAHLMYGIQVGGFVLLTGEVGTGKTTIIRCLLEQLPDDTDIAIVLNPMASAPELLSIVCDELGVSYASNPVSMKGLIDSLHGYLLQSHKQHRKTVLLIDEAQLLAPSVLEQIRLLTNLETTTEKLLQIILVGQPELKRLLEQPSLRQLSQRITARFHLEALSLAETQAYIAHRLTVAGMSPQQKPFSLRVINTVHKVSGGIPRVINMLCERLLLGAYAKNKHQVDQGVLRQAIFEVLGQSPKPDSRTLISTLWRLALVASVLLVLVGAFMFGRFGDQTAIAVPANILASELLAPVVSEASLPSLSPFWVRDKELAWQALLSYVAIAEVDSCTSSSSIVCEEVQLGTWDDVIAINRPAVLTLVTEDKKLAYVTLVGLIDERALVISNNQPLIVAWIDLAAQWNGSVSFLWRRPKGFDRPVVLGDKGPFVTWLAQQFVKLDQQEIPITRDIFTANMKKRIEIFQASQQLKPDGIVGAQTLRRLNDILGIDRELITDEVSFSELATGGFR